MRILSNVTFLFVSLSYTAESAIVTAFITFIPKFIESQFGIPASSASIYTGELQTLSEQDDSAKVELLLLTTCSRLVPACSAAIQRVGLSPEKMKNKESAALQIKVAPGSARTLRVGCERTT